VLRKSENFDELKVDASEEREVEDGEQWALEEYQ
jgi:hypothetical protein